MWPSGTGPAQAKWVLYRWRRRLRSRINRPVAGSCPAMLGPRRRRIEPAVEASCGSSRSVRFSRKSCG
jgi:hypothetical protein